MNIFYLDKNVKKCAQMHNNKHCIKMIVEYAQLLSTAHNILDKTNDYLKSTHINHPCAIWTRNGYENYIWLARLLRELSKEYTYRYDKIHLYENNGLIDKLQYAPFNISLNKFYEPPCAMPKEYIIEKRTPDEILSGICLNENNVYKKTIFFEYKKRHSLTNNFIRFHPDDYMGMLCYVSRDNDEKRNKLQNDIKKA